MKLNYLSLTLLFAMLLASCATRESRTDSPADKAAREVIERTLGRSPRNLVIEVTGRDSLGRDYFSTEAADGRLIVKGSTPVAVCRGFYDYVKQNGYGVVTWSANTVRLPRRFPDQELRTVVSPFKHRYYMNVCTMGYTHPYKQWEDWERELDWMALHGFDMPLAPIASEAIFARVWRKLGLTEEEIGEFVTGPAHLPWFRMGNMSRLDGPMSQEYYDKTIALQHRIVDRMNELGMTPIYNAFAGFVPESIKRIYPDVEFFKTGWGGGEYYVSHFISPETELFHTIAKMYIEEWEREFGKCEYYLADSFNEMKVPFAARGTKERFDQIAAYGKTIYESIKAANPDAVWVLQGWMFGYQRYIWDPESIKALFSDVPDDKVMLLDLSVDFNYGIWRNEYTWNYAPGIYGKQWVYSTVPNFGGRSCPVGDVEFYLNGHLRALNSPNRGNLMGYGTAPEGVENNEVIYEAIGDAAWSESEIPVREWLKNYTELRYGSCPEALVRFWDKMLESSYSICSNRAQYRIQKRPYNMTGGRYDTSPAHFEGIEAFIDAAAELGNNETYLTDLAMWAGYYAFGKADLLAEQIHRCYILGESEKAAGYEKEFVRLMKAADRFMESYPDFRIERWIDFARSWGDTPEQSDAYETNARRLITTWGPGKGPDGLNDYACRIWSGVIRDYYIPRWEHYFESMKSGEPFDFDAWEYKYVEEQRGVSPVEPYDDMVEAARELVESCRNITRDMNGCSDAELSGWTPMELSDNSTRFVYVIDPLDMNDIRGVRIRWTRGNDAVVLKKVQLNGGGTVQAVADTNEVIGGENPVVEIPLDVRKSDKLLGDTYLHVVLDKTKACADSYALVELIK